MSEGGGEREGLINGFRHREREVGIAGKIFYINNENTAHRPWRISELLAPTPPQNRCKVMVFLSVVWSKLQQYKLNFLPARPDGNKLDN